MNVKKLDLFTLPLHGTHLIEASAGTGKTYFLAGLYLRLLLGLGGSTSYPRPLSVKEILVVTFTRAATEELRNRIYNNIHQLRQACLRGKSTDTLLSGILSQIKDLSLAALYLLTAERQIDEAAIYTIHGFCQRVLNQHTIESGMLFQKTMLQDESTLQMQVSADFWRRHFYPLPLEVARIIQKDWEEPSKLLAEVLPYLQGELPKLCNPPKIGESILTQHTHIISKIENFKQQWRVASATLKTTLNECKMDRRTYNNKNITHWLSKINYWVTEPTVNYQVPNELIWFKISTLAKKTTSEIPQHKLFSAVENFYRETLSLRKFVLFMAITEIRKSLEQEKKQQEKMGFDDCLNRLDQLLADPISNRTFTESIRKCYPVAIIDEFQDTNPQQYRIFHRIYYGQPTCGLLLIGDPKQAIYAFRGADIFTYIHARSEVNNQYTLDTNWRSATGMVNAINKLFQRVQTPFIFKSIPFSPILSTKNNANLRLVVQNQDQPALNIWIQPGKGVKLKEYQQYMAHQCATTIKFLLKTSSEGKAWLEGRAHRQPLQASDITVLVRNYNEASLIREKLSTLMIPATFISNRDNVFETLEALEIQWILRAVLMPEDNTALRCAFATELLGFNSYEIDELNNNKNIWEKKVKEFVDYKEYWKKNSILSMLVKIMVHYRIAESLLATQGGERRLTNVFHLGELLQETSMQLKNEFSLLHWLSLQIESPSLHIDNHKLRLESDRHLVQITTVHKSKGLEFPIVFIPFPADFRIQEQALFHDRETYTAYLDLSASQENLQLAEEERLAEDLRLLYVALTRSIYHCSLGVAPLYQKNRKKFGNSDLHLSAVGYLIQQGHNGNADDLRRYLKSLVACSGGDIAFCEALSEVQSQPLTLSLPQTTQTLNARNWSSIEKNFWKVTSYSSLRKYKSSALTNQHQEMNLGQSKERGEEQKISLTPHTFPRGTEAGKFLHKLFTLDFNRPLNMQWLKEQLAQQHLDITWLQVIIEWRKKIINTLLDEKFLSLSHLTPNSYHSELEFCLPIHNLVQAHDLDLLCKHYDVLSAHCPPLDFSQIKGMLKGFIDLFFRWKNRYYLLDYKSNWLGQNSSVYTPVKIENTIITHRYELQYQLYTLALHRFLRHRLVNYDYQRDFGGVYYIFLRGIDEAIPKNGIFYCRPSIKLIDAIDNLFKYKTSSNRTTPA